MHASRQTSSCARLGADEASPLRNTYAALLGPLLSIWLFGADVDLDLLGLRFGFFGQSDLQDALVVVGRDVLGVDRVGRVKVRVKLPY